MPNSRLLVASCCVALCIPGALAARADERPAAPVSADFDAYVAAGMKQWAVPGLALAIVHDGKTYVKGYGVRSLDQREPVDGKTVFAIGSSSKAFTAAMLGMLVDEHKIAWDDALTKDLPGFEMYDPWVSRQVTVRDALTHRTGLAGTLGEFALWYASGLSRDEIVHRIRYLEPAYSFRSQFDYNNLMVLAAGQVIPAVTGLSWDRFLNDRLFVPLGMNDSSSSIHALAGNADLAQPYEEIDGKLKRIPYRYIDNIGPAGSINSNVTDMSHWVQMLLDGGTYANRRLLSAKTVAELFAPQTIMPLGSPWTLYAPASKFLDYALNWLVYDYHGHKMVQHAGNIDGMTAMVSLAPDLHLGIVILTNKGGNFLTSSLLYRIYDQTLGLPPHDWSSEIHTQYATVSAAGHTAQRKADAARVRHTHPSLPLEKYVGTYHAEPYGDAVVSGAASGLRFRMLGFRGRLEHWNYDTFGLIEDDPVVPKVQVSFTLSPAGTVANVRIEGDASLIFSRVVPPAAAFPVPTPTPKAKP